MVREGPAEPPPPPKEYPAEKARGGEIILKTKLQRAVFIAGPRWCCPASRLDRLHLIQPCSEKPASTLTTFRGDNNGEDGKRAHRRNHGGSAGR